jgi:acetone carboxylase gamma subunit
VEEKAMSTEADAKLMFEAYPKIRRISGKWQVVRAYTCNTCGEKT